MNDKKTLAIPKTVRRRVSLPAEAWRNCGLKLNHMVYRGGALVSAEGAKTVFELSPVRGYSELYCDGACAIAYSRVSYLTWLQRDATMTISNVNDICGFTESDEGRITYIYTDSKLHFERSGSLFDFASVPGGQSVVTHMGRVFAASDDRIYWGVLMQTTFKDKSAQGAGNVFLADYNELGKVMRMVSVGNYVYLFREYGVMRMYAGADPLEFRLEGALLRYASLQVRSVATDCGKIYFFADERLFCLEGETVAPVPNAATEELLFSQKIFGACNKGNYFAAVTCRDGRKKLYAYDAEFQCGRYIGIEALGVTALQELYFLRGDGKVCVLDGSAAPETGEQTALFEYDFSSVYDQTTYLEAITIDGQGMFAVEAYANGERALARGGAGKRLAFEKALCADKVRFTIKPLSQAFALKGVTLFKRREDAYGN